MRTKLSVLMTLLLSSVVACEPEQDLGANKPGSQAGTSGTAGGEAGASQAGASQAGASQAGAAGAELQGGTNSGGSNLGGSNLGGSNLGGSELGGSNQGGSGLAGTSAAGTSSGGANLGGAGQGGSGQGGGNLSGNGGTGGSGLAGANQGGAAGAGGGTPPPLSCPPIVKSGKLNPVPYASGYLTHASDLRFGKTHRYLLEDPWVDVDSLGAGGAHGWVTLDLNQGNRSIALVEGPVTIPGAWLTLDKIQTMYMKETGETLLALRTKSQVLSYAETPPSILVDGKDVYWSLRVPARVVEAPLGGNGSERVIASYEESTGIAPLAIALDDQYIYWSTGKPDINGFFEVNQEYNKVYRVLRHNPAAQPEEIWSHYYAADTLLLDGDTLYLGLASGSSDTIGVLPKNGGQAAYWGNNSYSFRIGRMALLDGYLYYTERNDNDCSSKLRRINPKASNQLYKEGELLIDGMYFPSNLITHEGQVYFTTSQDTFSDPGGTGGLFSYEPGAATCLSCGDLYNNGPQDAVCAQSENFFAQAFVCGVQNGCQNLCQLPSKNKPLSANCKSCLEKNCSTEVAACKADKGN